MRDAIWLPAAVLALTLCSGAASADADGPDFFEVRNVARNDTLSIRAKPDLAGVHRAFAGGAEAARAGESPLVQG